MCRKRDSFTGQRASSTYYVSGTPPNIGNTKENKKTTISALRELTASKRRPTWSDSTTTVWNEGVKIRAG